MSDKPVISVENLGKAYFLGKAADKHATFADVLVGAAKGAVRRFTDRVADASKSSDAYWAVRNASFDVNRGEVLGLVGRNGAGKSTMLKMLSRITEPTEGRAVIRGRVASLLEVGTGFHPELTGRENIFLNGAILGMRRTEITRKFDEIVAFSEVEQFLDTPVKRYSSGMYVRLAFAVAAHLDPEVLIVDEVLAVGDATFQKKCLGKMGDVMRAGRTVLFVSHNMDAVTNLCTHVVLVNKGKVSDRLHPEDGVKQYLATTAEGMGVPLSQKQRTQYKPRPAVFTDLKIETETGHDRVLHTGGRVRFDIELSDCQDIKAATVGLAISDNRGKRVALFHSMYHSGLWIRGAQSGRMTLEVPSLPLTPGNYYVELVMADDQGYIDRVERADKLDIVFGDMLGTGKIPSASQSVVVLPAHWDIAGGLDRAAASDIPGEVGGVQAYQGGSDVKAGGAIAMNAIPAAV
ncbi:ABC transporter ATP-binding protein [Humisphaera borealis]|uniref:ABC transporter ATP-binding protein n=1 Tax=Humisphaera borealis TaxID=2807512 RepID=A0A7M2WQY1_9BACT|nr:ABC transporter ATP-binding protein [Humisphaera borealis]QOV87965.1 ABC transporter ATP-binding protein [Humisphaera borealis]